MATNITIELCAEDRARLDKIIKALEKAAPRCDTCLQTVKDLLTAQEGTQKEPQKPEATEPTKQDTPKTEKAPEAKAEATESAPAAAPQPEEDDAPQPAPSVTLEQIQQKVVQLCALDGGAKKATVREIISQYGQKVSDLKDQPDKWDAVWAQLCALE